MRGLTALQIVGAWDAGQPLDAAGRAIAILQAASDDDASAMTAQEIATRLVALRAATFGPAIEARVTCAACGTALELLVRCDDIAAEPPTEFLSTCEDCGAISPAPFDIRDFMWRELAASAERLLDEVHIIASAYGWSEHEILAMASARRGRYLARLGEADAATSAELGRDATRNATATTPAITHAAGDVPADQRAGHIGSSMNDATASAVGAPANRAEAEPVTTPLMPRLATRWALPNRLQSAAAPMAIAPTSPAADRAVHVHIGRLDIRAALPEGPRGRRATATREPSLGLADYLQRREEQAR
jgi:hypothetical protein